MKTKFLKFTSKMMLILILATSVLTLSSCHIFEDADWNVHYKEFHTHFEFANFIQDYNSNADSNISSFFSFNFDNDNGILDKYYKFRTRAPYKAENLYDKNTVDTNVELIFYYDNDVSSGELEYKIKCVYRKSERNFSHTDKFEIKTLTAEEMSGEYLINSKDYQDERLSNDNKKYNHVYSLALLVNGENIMSIKISSTQELPQVQLDGVSQILLDNMIIIGAEDNETGDFDNVTEDNLEILFGTHTPTNNPNIYQTQFYATYYFSNLTTNYGDNYIGSCSYVSLAMLLSYYDSYWNDYILSDDENGDIYDAPAFFSTTDSLDSISSPGILNDGHLCIGKLNLINTGKTDDEKQNNLTYTQYFEVVEDNSSNYFHLKLIELGRVSKICELYEFFNVNPYGLGQNGRKKLINHYLYDYKNFEKEHIYYECVTTNVEDYIIINVSHGIPVLIAVAYADGGGHALIVYDYDQSTGKLYGHMGWGSNLTHIDLSSMGYLYIKNAATIKITTGHNCSNNYVDSSGITHCSCYFPCHPEHEHKYEASAGAENMFHVYKCGCVAENDTPVLHRFETVIVDNDQHKDVCIDCGYESEAVAHNFEYTTNNDETHTKSCLDCGFSTTDVHNYTTYNHCYEKCTDCENVRRVVEHNYTYDYVSKNNLEHYGYCICGSRDVFEHDLYETNGHIKCYDCTYQIAANHVHSYLYTPISGGRSHKKTCSCGISTTEMCIGRASIDGTSYCVHCGQEIRTTIFPLSVDEEEDAILNNEEDYIYTE